LRESDRARSGFYRLSAADIVMVSVVLAVSAGALFWMGTRDARGAEGAIASILVGDRVVETLPLNEDKVLRLRDVGMTFEVRDGRVRVVESDCPHDVCVNTGWICRSGQIIACVPNRVVVRIEEPEEPFLDAVVQ
jgi:hypothetical protein